MGKVFFLKGLWVLIGKAPVVAGAFFDSLTSLAGWGNWYGMWISFICLELGGLGA